MKSAPTLVAVERSMPPRGWLTIICLLVMSGCSGTSSATTSSSPTQSSRPTEAPSPTKSPDLKALLASFKKAESPVYQAACNYNKLVPGNTAVALSTAKKLVAAEAAALLGANKELRLIKWPGAISRNVAEVVSAQAAEAFQGIIVSRARSWTEFNSALKQYLTLNGDSAAKKRIVLSALGADPGQPFYPCY
jgi:hypothetical protein